MSEQWVARSTAGRMMNPVLTFEEIAALPDLARWDYLDRQEDLDRASGTSVARDYLEWEQGCRWEDPETGSRCGRMRVRPEWPGRHCAEHMVPEVDFPERVKEIRRERARAKLLDTLEHAVDRLAEIIDDEDVPMAVRLKAVENVLDRAGLPRMSGVGLDARVEVTGASDAAGMIAERLDRLASQVVSAPAIPVESRVLEQGGGDAPPPETVS